VSLRLSGATKPRSSLRPIFFWAHSPRARTPPPRRGGGRVPRLRSQGFDVLERLGHALELAEHLLGRGALADAEGATSSKKRTTWRKPTEPRYVANTSPTASR